MVRNRFTLMFYTPIDSLQWSLRHLHYCIPLWLHLSDKGLGHFSASHRIFAQRPKAQIWHLVIWIHRCVPSLCRILVLVLQRYDVLFHYVDCAHGYSTYLGVFQMPRISHLSLRDQRIRRIEEHSDHNSLDERS